MPWYSARMTRYYLSYLTYMRNKVLKTVIRKNKMKGEAFKTELATAYPEARLVVTKETMTVEGMIKIVYDLLKDKLNIAKITFTSGVNAGSAEIFDQA